MSAVVRSKWREKAHFLGPSSSLIWGESEHKIPLIEAGLEIAEDACSSKQVEPNSKLVRKAQRSREAMLAYLDLKVMKIHGDESAIPNLNIHLAPSAIGQSKPVGHLSGKHAVSSAAVNIRL